MKGKNNFSWKISTFVAIILFISIMATPMVSSFALEKTFQSHIKENKNKITMKNFGGDIIYVPDDYKTIQKAIDNASDGDTIIVRDGTYKENIVVDKQVTINGSGYNFTIIDGGGNDDTVKIYRDGVTISFFSIQNSSSDKAGIRVASCCNNFLLNEVTRNGYGFILESSHGNNITDNWIINNTIEGIYVAESRNNQISGNNISRNGNNGIMVNLSSTFNIISGNIALDNNLYGAAIDEGSRANTYIGNQLSINEVGIKGMGASDNNIFHHNDFKYNIYENANDSSNDTWSTLSEGNYWSDFDEPEEGAWDNDSDGIADDPYFIPGGDNKDPFPLMVPSAPNSPEVKSETSEVKKGEPWEIHVYTPPIPNYDEVYYEIYWGNGQGTEDTGVPVNTTNGIDISHTFNIDTKKTYNVKARAYVYIEGEELCSPWVHISVSVTSTNEKNFTEVNDNFTVSKLKISEQETYAHLKIKTAIFNKIGNYNIQTLDIFDDCSSEILPNIFRKNIIIDHFLFLSQIIQKTVFRKLPSLKI